MPSKGFSPPQLILAMAGAVVATIVALEQQGLIRHTDNKQDRPVGEFTAIYLKAGEQHRLSPKEAEVHAECVGGLLVVASDSDTLLKGLLVDYRNRGIRCATDSEQQ